MAGRITLATMYGVGLVEKAPGTAGSAVAALLAYFIFDMPFGMMLLLGGTVMFTLWGTKSSAIYMAEQGTDHDPGEIVVDELTGQWLTYLVAFFAARKMECMAGGACGNEFYTLFPNLTLFTFLGFLLFRLFDIFKPWPISLVDRKVKGGFGVMADDLAAAIPAGILLAFLFPMIVVFFV